MEKKTHIVCFGDSITLASGVAENERWPTLLGQTLEAWRPGCFRVFNRGIGSNTSAQGVDRMAADVIPCLPGLVLVQFGYNDAHMPIGRKYARVGLQEFENKLREIHHIARAYKSRCVFILNHTERSPDVQANGKSYTANYLRYHRRIQQTARVLRAPTIDLPADMRRREVDLDTFLAEDGIHLTVEGNRIYAEMVYDGLREQRLVK